MEIISFAKKFNGDWVLNFKDGTQITASESDAKEIARKIGENNEKGNNELSVEENARE